MQMEEQTQQSQTNQTPTQTTEVNAEASQPINYEETITNLKQSNDLLKTEITLLKSQINNLVNAFSNRITEEKTNNKQNFETMKGDFV